MEQHHVPWVGLRRWRVQVKRVDISPSNNDVLVNVMSVVNNPSRYHSVHIADVQCSLGVSGLAEGDGSGQSSTWALADIKLQDMIISGSEDALRNSSSHAASHRVLGHGTKIKKEKLARARMRLRNRRMFANLRLVHIEQ